jgi:hypothetical protein
MQLMFALDAIQGQPGLLEIMFDYIVVIAFFQYLMVVLDDVLVS